MARPLAHRLSWSWLLGGYYITGGWNISEYRFQTVLGLNGPKLLGWFPDGGLLGQRFAGLSQSIVVAKLPLHQARSHQGRACPPALGQTSRT